MNKSLISVTILASLFTSSAFANSPLEEKDVPFYKDAENYDGFHAGINSGFKLIGYDFNEVIGINLSTYSSRGHVPSSGEWEYIDCPEGETDCQYSGISDQWESDSYLLDVEVGHVFTSGNFHLKPYVFVGGEYTKISGNKSTQLAWGSHGDNAIVNEGYSEDEFAGVYGFGIRADYRHDLYVNLKSVSNSDYIETEVIFGWKF